MLELGFLRTERFAFLYGAEQDSDLAKLWSAIHDAQVYMDATTVELSDVQSVTFMLLTPPCTDYCPLGSRKGHRGKTGHLLLESISIILKHRPKGSFSRPPTMCSTSTTGTQSTESRPS